MRLPIEEHELRRFVTESNAIEGIRREPTTAEMVAHVRLWDVDRELQVSDLELFVAALDDVNHQGLLRRERGDDVIIGGSAHIPPRGGPRVETRLVEILVDAGFRRTSPYVTHARYEALHPFMDGNGRSGRALWAWQMLWQKWDDSVGLELLFLHQWYRQSLEEGRRV